MEKHTTVIIADSAEEFCNALSNALQRTDGFRVVGTATDGEQIIRMVTELKPAILVLDMMLSKKDGISVLKARPTLCTGFQTGGNAAHTCLRLFLSSFCQVRR